MGRGYLHVLGEGFPLVRFGRYCVSTVGMVKDSNREVFLLLAVVPGGFGALGVVEVLRGCLGKGVEDESATLAVGCCRI